MKVRSKFSIIAILSVALVACGTKQKENSSTLAGSVKDVQAGKIYLQKFNNKMYTTIDSVDVNDGKFEFNTSGLELPELYALTLNPERGQFLTFLEDGPLTVIVDSSSYYRNTKLQGSPLQDSFVVYQQQDDNDFDISEYIKANPNSLVSAYILYRNYSYRLTPAEIEKI